MKQRKQRAELRVVIRENDRHSLVAWAKLEGFDLYYGPAGNLLRGSYHETGAAHLHTPAGRVDYEKRVMPATFSGKLLLGSAGGCIDYNSRPDTPYRRSLIIDASRLRSCAVDLWAIEGGRKDLVQEVLEETSRAHPKVDAIVDHVVADWTQPQLLAVVRSFTEYGFTRFLESRRDETQ